MPSPSLFQTRSPLVGELWQATKGEGPQALGWHGLSFQMPSPGCTVRVAERGPSLCCAFPTQTRLHCILRVTAKLLQLYPQSQNTIFNTERPRGALNDTMKQPQQPLQHESAVESGGELDDWCNKSCQLENLEQGMETRPATRHLYRTAIDGY